MGLGQYDVVSLKKAREEAETLRRIVREGIDPIEARKAAKMKAQVEAATSILFKDAVGKCLARKEGEFRSEKHGASWRRSMDAYAVPIIGDMNTAHITTQDILRVLNQPFEDGTLWEKRTETASRLRGRIEAVLSWATVAGYRSGDNPARWAGNLKELLPTPSKVAKATKRPAPVASRSSEMVRRVAQARRNVGAGA